MKLLELTGKRPGASILEPSIITNFYDDPNVKITSNYDYLTYQADKVLDSMKAEGII